MSKFNNRNQLLTAAIALALSLSYGSAAAAADRVKVNNTTRAHVSTGDDLATSITANQATQDVSANENQNSAENSSSKEQVARETAEQKQATQLKAVTVTGIAGSQAKDIILKRYAPQIQDSITAEDIGKLPDITITDSLQRVTGVQINRSAGEGSSVNIRGLSEVLSTLNGEQFLNATTLGTTAANFVNTPPTMFQGVDVIKSTTASDVAGGISGIINLRTHRPFDFKSGLTLSGEAQASYDRRVTGANPELSILASYRTDRWGALLTVSHSKADLENQSVGLAGVLKSTEAQNGFDFNGDGVIGNSLSNKKIPRDYFYTWGGQRFGNTLTDRKRDGLNGSFQFKINSALTLIADAAYTKLNESTAANNIYLANNGDVRNNILPGSRVDSNGVLSYGRLNFIDFLANPAVNNYKAKSINTNLELKYDDGGFFTGDARWVHGHAMRTTSDANSVDWVVLGNNVTRADGSLGPFNPNGIPTPTVDVDYTGGLPKVNFQSNVSDPNNWQMTRIWGDVTRDDGSMNVFRADGALHFLSGIVDSLQFGARYEKRDYVHNPYRYLMPVSPAGACATPDRALWYFGDVGKTDSCTGANDAKNIQFTSIPNYWHYYNNFGPLKIKGLGPRGVPMIDTSRMTNPLAFINAFYPGAAPYRQASAAYDVGDKTTSVYGQLNLNGEMFDGNVPWSANAGVRGVRTRLDIGSYMTDTSVYIGNTSANGVTPSIGATSTINSYTDWLPSVNLSVDVTDNQKIRLAYDKAVARQDLGTLGQGLQVAYTSNGSPPKYPQLPESALIFVFGSSGNPDLKPFRSSNYNASYSWYFADRSLLSLGAYFMRVKSFPISETIDEPIADADGVVRAGGPISTTINGGGAIIKGLEFGYRQAFTFLPDWLSGFGTEENFTYSKAQSGQRDLFDTRLPVPDNSRDNYNAVVFYQKYGLQVRAAYNWRSRTFNGIYNVGSDALAVWTRPTGYLDASISYDINKFVSVYLQGTNLTNSYVSQYAQFKNNYVSANITDRRYYAGVRVTF